MRISVFGLGYVGSVSAACLAKAGHEVFGVDSVAEKVAAVNAGTSPVIEPGLDELLAAQVRAGKLRATTSSEEAISSTELALICVGTPARISGQLDVSAVERVAEQIGQALRSRTLPFTVVLRSTVLPGTTEKVLLPPLLAATRRRDGPALRVAVNPEFMREGSALQDFSRPPFTLAGADDVDAEPVLRLLYAGVDAPFLRTSVRTAEMVKYTANAFHALKICFANEVADISAALGADGREVMRLFLMDRRLNVSEAYLRPGFAFGGSCLPKDVRALAYAARAADVEAPLLSSILPSNEAQIRRGLQEVLAAQKRRVGVIGLAFKPGTDDVRESPLLALVETLIGKGHDVRILDRHVALASLVGANRRFLQEKIPHIASLLCKSVKALVAHAEVLVIGHRGEDAARALAAVGPHQIVVDLTRDMARGRGRTSASGEALLGLG